MCVQFFSSLNRVTGARAETLLAGSSAALAASGEHHQDVSEEHRRRRPLRRLRTRCPLGSTRKAFSLEIDAFSHTSSRQENLPSVIKLTSQLTPSWGPRPLLLSANPPAYLGPLAFANSSGRLSSPQALPLVAPRSTPSVFLWACLQTSAARSTSHTQQHARPTPRERPPHLVGQSRQRRTPPSVWATSPVMISPRSLRNTVKVFGPYVFLPCDLAGPSPVAVDNPSCKLFTFHIRPRIFETAPIATLAS